MSIARRSPVPLLDFSDRNASRAFVSVIVPVHNGAPSLRLAMRALAASTFPRERYELIVVDDGSRDDCAAVASEYADVVIRLPGPPRGPAYARNRGAEVARGEILAFIDADVCLHPDALARLVDNLLAKPSLGAVCGIYDDCPGVRGLASRYANLVEHFEQLRACSTAAGSSYWSACSAVRRSAFLEAGMFDEWRFTRAQIEDRELGVRLSAADRQIDLCADVRATHLKRWSVAGLLASCVRDRGAPRARLANVRKVRSVDGASRRLLVPLGAALTWMAVVGGVATSATSQSVWPAFALSCLALAIVVDFPIYYFLARKAGLVFTLAAMPLHVVSQLAYGLGLLGGWILSHTVGDPRPDPVLEAYSEVGLKVWPPVPVHRDRVAGSQGK